MTTKRGVRNVMAAAAIVSAGALGGCTSGEVGRSSTFDVAAASTEDVARALERDGRVTLRGVPFETDSARLSEEGRAATARLADAMQAEPALRVAIVGHADSTGAFRHNLDLSQRRAASMADELVRAHGVAEDRIAPVGLGPLAPAAANDTAEGRAENRRVEVVVVQ